MIEREKIDEIEQCSICEEWYPKPVELYHTADECDLNVNEHSAASDAASEQHTS